VKRPEGRAPVPQKHTTLYTNLARKERSGE
jgi:hypothetical protein